MESNSQSSNSLEYNKIYILIMFKVITIYSEVLKTPVRVFTVENEEDAWDEKAAANQQFGQALVLDEDQYESLKEAINGSV